MKNHGFQTSGRCAAYLLLACLCLPLLTGTARADGKPKLTPEKVCENFLAFLVQEKWDKAYDMTTEGYQAQHTLQEFRALVNEYPAFHGKGTVSIEKPGVGTAMRMVFKATAKAQAGLVRLTVIVLQTEKGLQVGNVIFK